ncbi:esterase/lipase family protein [Candidatus Protofrankia datiscae]|uniref:esterase/lipase family protein n=4 Tax=Protofrankia TaxID=2994361 RepID=UPI0001C53C37|nr:hypothetical protein [Candidatus Protofrankia datiscae]
MSEQQSDQAEQALGRLTIADPLTTEPGAPGPLPRPDQEWQLRNGFAWVYYGEGSSGIERPVIMADGFNLGRSNLEWLYQGLEADFPLISTLRSQGRTVILLGFEERTASILDNAQAATEAVLRTIAERRDYKPLIVGGFSMGGLITRYALARMEYESIDHQTELYFSYDSPHRGAVIPIALQAFAHFIPSLVPGQENDFARQLNSVAARQMLWRHYNSENGEIRQDPERGKFLQALDRVGRWPRRPRGIGVANGAGDGRGISLPPGEIALKINGVVFPGTTLYTQATGNGTTVAELRRLLPPAARTITTDGFPELDGALDSEVLPILRTRDNWTISALRRLWY